MTYKQLQQHVLDTYYPALFLERVIHNRVRNRMHTLAWAFVSVFFIVSLAGYGATHTIANSFLIHFISEKIYGLFFISFAFWMVAIALQSFYNYFYNKDIPDDRRELPLVPFTLARIIYRTSESDILLALIDSKQGREIMLRSGISETHISEFISNRKHPLDSIHVQFKDEQTLSLGDYATTLFDADEEFQKFLFGNGIQKKELSAVCEWVTEREMAQKRRVRWWSRDKLGRVPGLGKNWAYGRTFFLEEYCRPIPFVGPEYDAHSIYGTKELQELENILVKEHGANVFLIGNDREEQIDIIARLNRLIDDGTVLPALEHKKVLLFDTELLTSSARVKADFETKLLQLMYEAAYAENIILAIVNFPALIASAHAVGSDVVSLLDQYFTTPALHIIALTTVEEFHTHIETNSALMQRFDRILMENIDENNTVKVLENELIPLENQYGVYFTYPALTALADGAVRYFPDALMPDRAIDLLEEIAPKLALERKIFILKDDVLSLISVKTGMPVGEIHAEERDKLLNLEKILHQRIIGQDEAVTAISQAVRRARSGINNPGRPLASFLFLGPTGVGKTESTKALGEIFFGAESKIERLDMSEYTGANALDKLIGSFDSGKPGVLSSMLREHPYGVLLLDEFEKTTPEVMNLFLQVLDEGVFSDMSGKKVNAHNLLIIATSNAGADIIWEGLKAGDDFSQAKDFIIDRIIQAGTFKPELINRFDGVIVFHPLGKRELEKVAKLQLERLQKRLSERGINLVITDDLINYIVGFGIDPKFGARPMNRPIQDKVEQAVADKMIRENLHTGAEVTLTLAELKQ